MNAQRFYYWFLAARPKTLAAGAIPVLIGSVCAYRSGHFLFLPAFFCLMFALFSQIAANFFNDYYDFKKGTDDAHRIGPQRAVASGWIAPRHLFLGAVISLGIGSLFGLGLIPYGGWHLIAVGVISAVFCYLYTAGPCPLAYIGLGDLLVVVFFGFIPVCFTDYVQSRHFDFGLLPIAIATGLIIDNILIANNYRDRENDRVHKKYTTVVLFGKTFGSVFYLMNGVIGVLLTILYFQWNVPISTGFRFLPLIYLLIHFCTWKKMIRLKDKDLNQILGESARNLVLFGSLFTAAMIL
ncbi:MAG: 1,4-dihydroxy-2-naphthoate octaprenyltransferase [Planctomycetia bacterium]|nr:1,4-dihydroxy-2-naphthoate octaprenyltransferase [Planctomycetia bacterium]